MIDWDAVLTWQNLLLNGWWFFPALAGLAYAWWRLK